jgi:D-glycero-D-manno-heptose 1,7-bisphosphate phosphatase
MPNRAVFLDRDGVLNRARVTNGVPRPPATILDLEVLPGAIEACALLRQAGFRLVVVTNQPDIARGRQTRAAVEGLNEALRRMVGFDDLFMCVHDDPDECRCRKPRPGMLMAAAEIHRLDLSASVMVGDRDRDIKAGRAAGCCTVFVDHGYGPPPDPAADLTVASLLEAVDWIMTRSGKNAKDPCR